MIFGKRIVDAKEYELLLKLKINLEWYIQEKEHPIPDTVMIRTSMGMIKEFLQELNE